MKNIILLATSHFSSFSHLRGKIKKIFLLYYELQHFMNAIAAKQNKKQKQKPSNNNKKQQNPTKYVHKLYREKKYLLYYSREQGYTGIEFGSFSITLW